MKHQIIYFRNKGSLGNLKLGIPRFTRGNTVSMKQKAISGLAYSGKSARILMTKDKRFLSLSGVVYKSGTERLRDHSSL